MTVRFFLYLLLVFIAAACGMVRFKKLTIPFKLLTGLLIYTLISEISSRIFAVNYRNSSPVYHLYIPVQFTFFVLIYSRLTGNEKYRELYVWSILAFWMLGFINLFFFQDILRFPSNTILIACSFLIGVSLFQFKKMLTVVEERSIFRQSVFWLNAGVLLFFTSTFLYWGTYNYLLKHHIKTSPLSTIIYYINILFYIFLGLGLLFDKRAVTVSYGQEQI